MGDDQHSWQATASLRALRPRVEAPSDGVHDLWQLPDWDAYSARSSLSASQPLALSVCTNDDSGDDASSLASSSSSSSSSSCVGVQRSPVALASVRVGASAAKRQSALRQLHQRYAQQRQTAALAVATTGDASGSSQQQQQLESRSTGDDAAAQWIALLSHKVELLASICGHDASSTQSSRAPPRDAHEQQQQQQQLDAELGAWRVGDAVLQTQVAPRVADTARSLERALAALSVAVERSSRRKLELFEDAIAQMQQFHREKLQRVMTESAEKLKLARSKHKAQREQLEQQLRAANRVADDWKLRAVEIERKSALERDKIELQAATFRDKFEKLSVRFDEDIVQITRQLESARRDKSDALRDRDALSEQLERLQQELAASLEQYSALAAVHQLQSSELEQAKQRWSAAAEQLHCENGAVVEELTRGKQELADLLEKTKRQHAVEVETLKNRFGMLAEDDYRAAAGSEKIVELQRRHENQLESMRAAYEQRVEEQGRAVEKALEEADAEERIRALSRKCRALENLLDKKFEEQSDRGSMSPLCMSCVSSSSRGSLKPAGEALASDYKPPRSSSQPTNNNFAVEKGYSSTSSNARLAAGRGKTMSSSPRSASPDPNDTLFTDVNTTMRNETWDQDSLTSTDTFDRMSPYHPPSRPQSAGSSNNTHSGVDGVPSNEDILALVRKLESYTASAASSFHEPESEQNTLYRTPESRATTRKSQPPPVHRTASRKEAARATRRPHKPSTLLTSKPLRGSLASGSSISSASPSSVSNQRHNPASRSSSAASNKLSAPRVAPFY